MAEIERDGKCESECSMKGERQVAGEILGFSCLSLLTPLV